jgi:hypothetical protein
VHFVGFAALDTARGRAASAVNGPRRSGAAARGEIATDALHRFIPAGCGKLALHLVVFVLHLQVRLSF